MNRRLFFTKAPALATGALLGASSEVARASETTNEGFKLLSKKTEKLKYKENSARSILFQVACPFDEGSESWNLAAKRPKEGPVLLSSPRGSYFSRWAHEITFPRLRQKPNGLVEGTWNVSVGEHLAEMFELALLASDGEVRWQFVHVVFLCKDGGQEHVFAGIPAGWSASFLLNVTVSYEIG